MVLPCMLKGQDEQALSCMEPAGWARHGYKGAFVLAPFAGERQPAEQNGIFLSGLHPFVSLEHSGKLVLVRM